VRILDAKPRGASCDEQVWPYFEHHCLRRAPVDRPGRASAPDAEAPASASQAGGPAGRVAVTSGVTPSSAVDHGTRLQAPTGARSGEAGDVVVDTHGVAALPRVSIPPPAADQGTVGAGTAAGLAAWRLSERSRQASRAGAADGAPSVGGEGRPFRCLFCGFDASYLIVSNETN
jgi:hypothetical protein